VVNIISILRDDFFTSSLIVVRHVGSPIPTGHHALLEIKERFKKSYVFNVFLYDVKHLRRYTSPEKVFRRKYLAVFFHEELIFVVIICE
jgi:hypothetical protein